MYNSNPDPSEIITRLKDRLDVESDAKLAELLGVPPSTLANWRRRRSLPYAVCVRVAQERGISLDWLILGKKGLTLDTSALALAAYHSRDALPLLELAEVEADVLGEAISKWYGEYVNSLDRVAATNRTREQATRLFYDALRRNSQTGAITEVIELQSRRRPSGIPEFEDSALEAPEWEELTNAPEAGAAEGSEPSIEQREMPEKSGLARGGGNGPASQEFSSSWRPDMLPILEPSPEHISPEQEYALLELITEAADYHIAAGMPGPYARTIVSSLLSRNFRVPRHQLIPKEFGDDAVTFMTRHIAKLRTKYDGADYVPWRTELYIAIYRHARKLKYSRNELFDIAFNHFGKSITTLKQLDDENLKKLCGIVMATERKPQRS